MRREDKKLPPEKREKLRKKLADLAAKRATGIGEARRMYKVQVAVAKATLADAELEINKKHKAARIRAIKTAHRKPRAKKKEKA